MMTAADVSAKQAKLDGIVEAIRTSVQKHVSERYRVIVGAERAALDTVMPSDRIALGHVLWMCDEVHKFILEQRWDKANRWIGFAQGLLWITGVASIDESRQVNQ